MRARWAWASEHAWQDSHAGLACWCETAERGGNCDWRWISDAATETRGLNGPCCIALQVKKLLRELETLDDIEESALQGLQSELDDQVCVCVCARARGAQWME